jgi:hypothetical protein
MNPNQEPNKSEEKDLSAEGIDLVGSGVNEENEFTSTNSSDTPPESSVEEPDTKVTNTAEQSAPVVSPEPTRFVDSAPKTPEAPILPPIKNDPSIKSIRTYKSDAEEAVRYQNISAIDIAVAEQKKRQASTAIEYANEKESHVGLFLIIIFFIIIGLGGGWFYWFHLTNTEETKTIQVSVETIVRYTKGSTLLLRDDSDPLVLIGAKLAAANAGLGNVYALVPTLEATSTTPAPIEAILKKTRIPARLLRSLSNYMIGTYTYDTNSPFIILKNTFFQNAFAGMLDWEKNMRNDLLPLITASYPDETAVDGNADRFEDIIVSNIDTRVLRNKSGKIILAYAFADTNTVIISTTEYGLSYLLGQLLEVRSIQ